MALEYSFRWARSHDEVGLELSADDNRFGVFFVGVLGDRLNVKVADGVGEGNFVDVGGVDCRFGRGRDQGFEDRPVVVREVEQRRAGRPSSKTGRIFSTISSSRFASLSPDLADR